MSTTDAIAAYLERLDRRLDVGRARDRILDEVRGHLEDAASDGARRGLEPAEAARQAVERFGSPEELAGEFNAERATRALRFWLPAVGGLGVAVAAGLAVGALAEPVPPGQATVPLPALIPLQAGLVAFQVAVVSGAIVAGRMAARWRASRLAAADRDLVRRGAGICIGALAVTSVAWTASLVARALIQGHSNAGLLAVASVVLATVVAVGATIGRRLWRLPADDIDAPDAAGTSGVLGLGERLVAAVLQRPVAACLGVAVLAGAGAAMRAESTLPIDLAWGAGEAACVIVAFIALGPALGILGRGGSAQIDAPERASTPQG